MEDNTQDLSLIQRSYQILKSTMNGMLTSSNQIELTHRPMNHTETFHREQEIPSTWAKLKETFKLIYEKSFLTYKESVLKLLKKTRRGLISLRKDSLNWWNSLIRKSRTLFRKQMQVSNFLKKQRHSFETKKANYKLKVLLFETKSVLSNNT